MEYELSVTKCPRCKENYLFKEEALNSLSRRDNMTYICPACGVEESMFDLFGTRDDLSWIPLTKLKAEQYVLNHGNECPYCVSQDITTTEQTDVCDGTAWQECRCRECGKHWRDVYSLSGVEEVDE